MDTVKISADFLLRAVNLEMSKAADSSKELARLSSIGYMNSQIGLDVANDVKTHLTKAYELLKQIEGPEVALQRVLIGDTIARQSMIISRIELSL